MAGDADMEPTEDERKSDCELIKQWETAREEPLDYRRVICRTCPMNTGGWPRSVRLFEVACEHRAAHAAGVSPPWDYYTRRERDAIVVVHLEAESIKAEKMENAR